MVSAEAPDWPGVTLRLVGFAEILKSGVPMVIGVAAEVDAA
jgi:hypothetical protein